MNFQKFLALAISLALSIWVVKVSAELAYKKEVSWEQAFLQGLLLLVLFFALSLFLDWLGINRIF